ncbi:unnamed protein product [Ilex paraguariensis]|uniref:Uncharacterized protein n=1 Tax=Ilex paraguariensis TaxID=185542 RepID=A0ABC8RBT9_9AQUA
MKASIDVGQETDRNSTQCNSLKVLIEEEVTYLIEAVTEEEKKKANMMEQNPRLGLEGRVCSFWPRFTSSRCPKREKSK